MKTPKIIDVTVKEGGFRVHHRILPEQVANLAHGLQSAGINTMEVSHGCGAGSFRQGYPGLHPDEDLLGAAREAAPELELCAFFAPTLNALREMDALGTYIGMGRVWVNVDDAIRAKEHLKKLKSLGKRTIALIERIHRRPPDQTLSAALQLQDMGADIIQLADTFSSLGPEDVKTYLGEIQNKVGVEIGFQARNNTGRAIANVLTAWEAGAEWLDASLLGLGPGGGLAPTEILVSLFQKQGQLETINLRELTYTAKWQAHPTFHSLPRTRFIDLMLAKHRLDYYSPDLLEKIADILDLPLETFLLDVKNTRPDMVQLREADLRQILSSHSLDFDVVLQFLQTGKIPSESGA